MKLRPFFLLFSTLSFIVGCAGDSDHSTGTVSLDSYNSERVKCDSLEKEIGMVLRSRISDTLLNVDTSFLMMMIQEEAKIALYEVDQMLRDYMRNATGTVVPDTGNFDPVLNDPNEYEISTSFFLGEKPETPIGKGLELYDALAKFGDGLHDDVPFFIPNNHTDEQREQWVKDSFYHATPSDVLVRMTLFRLNVLQAMKYSFDNGLYRELK